MYVWGGKEIYIYMKFYIMCIQKFNFNVCIY